MCAALYCEEDDTRYFRWVFLYADDKGTVNEYDEVNGWTIGQITDLVAVGRAAGSAMGEQERL